MDALWCAAGEDGSTTPSGTDPEGATQLPPTPGKFTSPREQGQGGILSRPDLGGFRLGEGTPVRGGGGVGKGGMRHRPRCRRPPGLPFRGSRPGKRRMRPRQQALGWACAHAGTAGWASPHSRHWGWACAHSRGRNWSRHRGRRRGRCGSPFADLPSQHEHARGTEGLRCAPWASGAHRARGGGVPRSSRRGRLGRGRGRATRIMPWGHGRGRRGYRVGRTRRAKSARKARRQEEPLEAAGVPGSTHTDTDSNFRKQYIAGGESSAPELQLRQPRWGRTAHPAQKPRPKRAPAGEGTRPGNH